METKQIVFQYLRSFKQLTNLATYPPFHKKDVIISRLDKRKWSVVIVKNVF